MFLPKQAPPVKRVRRQSGATPTVSVSQELLERGPVKFACPGNKLMIKRNNCSSIPANFDCTVASTNYVPGEQIPDSFDE